MQNNFSCLLSRKIYDILIGDTDLCNEAGKELKMPYLKTNDLSSLFTQFCSPKVYDEFGSRWTYMKAILEHMNAVGRTSEFLHYLFDLPRFSQVLQDFENLHEIEVAHQRIVQLALAEINKQLFFSQLELRQVGTAFHVVPLGSTAPLVSEPLKVINQAYIHHLRQRIECELRESNFDAVLSKSRTLVEEVLIYILEKLNEPNIPKGDFPRLANVVKNHLNLQQSGSFSPQKNSMLSGLEKIIQSVIEMRNSQSDSHGVGSRRVTLAKHEASLVVNCAITYAEFMYSEFEKTQI